MKNKSQANIVKILNLTKRYNNSDNYAVKKVTLELKGGEIFGILGPNGAGKSTIIKSLVGLQPITQGEINICGYDLNKQDIQAKKEIGYVPDHYILYEKLTGREFINYMAQLYDIEDKEKEKAINKYLKLLNLTDVFDKQIKTYSHGMKQKITIISALIHNPKLWILDEPLTGLDPDSIFQVKECMKEHVKKGNIVFFSSHIIDVVEKMCDRIAILNNGKILSCKSVSEIQKITSIEKYYQDLIKGGQAE